jgi:predicted nucleic acid-binding protein
VADKFFLDTNILLYSIDDDERRTPIAKELVFAGTAIVSTQVLNEFVNIAAKKFKLSRQEISKGLGLLKMKCEIVPLTLSVHERAWEIFSVTNLGIYDSNIVAAAELAECDVLYSEDMNHGQRVGKVEIRNPFMFE